MTTTTTTGPLHLEPVTPHDIPSLTTVWFAAFCSPLARHLVPNTPGVHAWFNESTRISLIDKPAGQARFIKVVDPKSIDPTTGCAPRIVAYAKWDTGTMEERGARFPPWHEDMPVEELDVWYRREDSERVRVMGERKHYYLDTVVTHPDYQRRGAASMLVKWGCGLADEHGVAAYVDASKDGAPLYQKFGFVDMSPPDAKEVASMVREARR